jgi:CheY-like chemotaxis protein
VAEASAPLKGLRVLVVEDELVIAMELESLLKRLGCIVLDPAPSIRRALCLLSGKRPDAAVLDVNLQGKLVTPVAEALQEQHVPFVLVTGYETARLHDEALRSAVHVRKPVDEPRLEKALCKVLASGGRSGPDD